MIETIVICPKCETSNTPDADECTLCGCALKRAQRAVVHIGTDNRCLCHCMELDCPLGKTGMEFRCTREELERVGVTVLALKHETAPASFKPISVHFPLSGGNMLELRLSGPLTRDDVARIRRLVELAEQGLTA